MSHTPIPVTANTNTDPIPAANANSIIHLEDYRRGQLPVAPETRRWHLYGAGMEQVGGMEGRPDTIATPRPAPHELLVRHDAVGICFSDIKIVNLGAGHPRLAGRDLAEEPVVMGHEVALTVVQVGDALQDRFAVGQRFIVQADIFYQGRGLAYGYALPGGMSEYGLVGPEVLDGDEGCYLLPITDTTGYADAALVEPWACVEAAYRWQEPKPRPKAEADYLIVPQWNELEAIDDPEGYRHIWYPHEGFESFPLPRHGAGYREIFLSLQMPDAYKWFEKACAYLAKNGVAHISWYNSTLQTTQVDVGRIHYDGHIYRGDTDNRRNQLKPGGTAWFVGAAGPMGQMHVQRALSLAEPPAVLVCTDRNPARIAALRDRYLSLAEERGVKLLNFNVKTDGKPDFAVIAPDGFDDIVVMVPDVEAIEEAFPYLADGGVLNIFAGVARGTMANLNMNAVALRDVRIVGTSGSTIADMRHTLAELENGRLDTGASLAAIGGLEAFKDGLLAVRNGTFPGKTVIFPHVKNLPLTALPDLKHSHPSVYERLRDGRFWTWEAEEELLRLGLAA